MRGGGTILDAEGREALGRRKGYRYFGRAKELPGVKEAFESGEGTVSSSSHGLTGGDNDDEKSCYEFRLLGLGLSVCLGIWLGGAATGCLL
jgi:hypothetical protein